VVVVLDRERREALPEQVAPALVAAVEGLRVDAVQPLHARGEAVELRFDDEVVVVRHQAEDVDPPVVAFDDAREQPQEQAALVVVPKDGRAGDTSGGHMEDPGRRELLARTSHAANVDRARRGAASLRAAAWTNPDSLVTPAVAARANSQGQSLVVPCLFGSLSSRRSP
jgi:hypothetical protein